MNYEIKSLSGAVLFTAELPEHTPSGAALRHALEKATSSFTDLRGADLRGADLYGANLRYANLRSADLYGADLRSADLRSANLRSADLRGADLRGADLYGADLRSADLYGADLRSANLRSADLRSADLRGADLRGADLYGAKVTETAALAGERPLLQIGPIGSRVDTLSLYLTSEGPLLRTGCFSGTRAEFEAAVTETHGGGAIAEEYMAALVLMDAHTKLWTPE